MAFQEKYKMYRRFVYTLILFFVFPAPGNSYRERLILSMDTDGCSIRFLVDDESGTMRLRIQPEYPRCVATKDDIRKILKTIFSKTDPLLLNETYTSLYLGRLIDYPWLSEYLADAAYKDQGWNKNKGKPVSLDINQYVSTLLMKKDFTLQFDEAFGDSGYRVVGVSVEKVLVGPFSEIFPDRGEKPPGKVPYDAMVWLGLEKSLLEK
jgi:hypothetical protein